MAIQTFTIECTDVQQIAPEVKQFKFILPSGEKFLYVPGQFITLHLQGSERELKRSYSISIHTNETDAIEFVASYVKGGIATELLFNIQIGEQLTCSGPYGRLILPAEDPARYILIATGTGITPYRAMLPDLKKRLEKPEVSAHVLFGTRLQKDILFQDDFTQFSAENDRFAYTSHLSREQEARAPHERLGYVQHYFDKLALNPEQDLVYLCGNPDMIDSAYAQLKELGFTPRNVKREKYISK